MNRFAIFASVLTLTFADPTHVAGQPVSNKLGTIDFPVSCNAAAQTRFNTAMALLHSFWYDRSEEVFREVASADPHCAMAYWGIAMSRWHELWEWPDANDVKVASAALTQAETIGPKTDKERRFITAIADFYRGYNPSTGLGGADRYTADMQALHASYPNDRQAALFYALALIATAPSDDKTFSQRLKAGAILEPIFAAEPNDPGAAHYIIHAYDDPALASRALHAALEYSKIAPAVPHALHMPSHTFTDLGMWEDSIASNIAALAAERQDYPNTEHLGTSNFDDFHCANFLEYADLQAGRERDAAALADQVAASRSIPDTLGDQVEYALTLSRGLIERHEWLAASSFSVPAAASPDLTQPVAKSIIDYVRGLGDARLDRVAEAKVELSEMGDLDRSSGVQRSHRMKSYLAVEEESLTGWIAEANGQTASAVISLRSAAAGAGTTDDPLPYFVWPMREQLAVLLLEQKRPADALAVFRQSLEQDPNRLQSLYGAAEAAGQIGDRAAALTYYRSIVASCPRADADTPEVAQAKQFIQSASTGQGSSFELHRRT